MTMAPDAIRVVDIDLSLFSLGSRWLWLSGPLGIFIIVGWIVLIPLLGYWFDSGPLMITLGIATLLVIAAGVLAMMKQRMSSSLTGYKSEFRAEQSNQRPRNFDRTMGEIVQAVDSFRRSDHGRLPDAAASAQGVDSSKRTRARVYIVLGVLIFVIGLPALIALNMAGGLQIALVFVAMVTMFTRARRVLQPSAELVRLNDPRPPILFLRSFRDDKIKVKARVVSLMGIPSYHSLRFEEAFGLRLRDFSRLRRTGSYPLAS
jgi:hypothetical protein